MATVAINATYWQGRLGMNRAVIVEGNVDTKLPEPMTPADCDLRGLPWMPLHTFRLLDSDLFILSTGDEFKAAVALWCKSWNQIPGGSLPNDERLLEGLSGAKNWKKIKEVAMRGWILCSDGRLYHPVVAEQAMQAWDGRQEHQEISNNKNSRQQRWREQIKEMSARLRNAGITPPMNPSKAELERLISIHLETPSDDDVDADVDATVDGEASTVRRPVDQSETAKRGRGTGRVYITSGTSPACDAPAHMPPRVIDTNFDPKHRFTLPTDWEPSPSFPAEMFRAGVNPDEFLTAKNLDEFVSYRRAAGESKTQALWEHALLQRLIAIRDRAATGGKSHANSTQNSSGNSQRLSPFQRVQAANPLGSSAEQPSRIIDVTPE